MIFTLCHFESFNGKLPEWHISNSGAIENSMEGLGAKLTTVQFPLVGVKAVLMKNSEEILLIDFRLGQNFEENLTIESPGHRIFNCNHIIFLLPAQI